MGKKIEPIKEKFIVVHDDKFEGSYRTYKEAESTVYVNELDGAVIYKVVQAWEAVFPEEPELEFHELTLEQV